MCMRTLYRLADSIRDLIPPPPTLAFPPHGAYSRSLFPATSSFIRSSSSPSTSSSSPSPTSPPAKPSAAADDYPTQLNCRIHLGVESRKFMLLLSLLATLLFQSAATSGVILFYETRLITLSSILSLAGLFGYFALIWLLLGTGNPPMVAIILCAHLWSVFLALYLVFGTNEIFVWFMILPVISFFIIGKKQGMVTLGVVLVQGFILPNIRELGSGGPTRTGLLAAGEFYTTPFGKAFTTNMLILCIGVLSFAYEYADAFVLQKLRVALEEKQLANTKLKQATDAKSKFLANMSHELRTPLHGIVAMAKELFATALTPKMREAVKIISDCADHLNALVDDILDFERIESGRMELEQIPFSIVKEADGVINMLTLPAEKKQLEMKKNFAVETEYHIGDPLRFRQILFNLLSNAIKFTPNGGRITTTLRNISNQPELVEIEILDTGIGIADENIANLFTSFYQLDSSIGRKYGGSGLGLAISKRLCEAMNGTIGCESHLGQGSRFWFTVRLPVTTPSAGSDVESDGSCEEEESEEESEQDMHPDQRPERRGSAQGIPEEKGQEIAPVVNAEVERPRPQRRRSKHAAKVLLVEDNVVNQKVGVRMLTSLGHQVDVAENGLIGFKMAEREHYDLILMDCQMPELDGFQATMRIREMERQNTRALMPDSPRAIPLRCAGRTMSAEVFEKPHFDRDLHGSSDFPTRSPISSRSAPSPEALLRSPTSALRATSTRPIPIIALTASATMDYQKRCLDCGMNDFLAKPLNREKLQNTLKRWLPTPPTSSSSSPSSSSGNLRASRTGLSPTSSTSPSTPPKKSNSKIHHDRSASSSGIEFSPVNLSATTHGEGRVSGLGTLGTSHSQDM